MTTTDPTPTAEPFRIKVCVPIADYTGAEAATETIRPFLEDAFRFAIQDGRVAAFTTDTRFVSATTLMGRGSIELLYERLAIPGSAA